MTNCIECGRPWGVILDRGKEPSEEDTANARAEMIDVLLHEVWDCDYDPEELARIDTAKFPPVIATEVIYITEATAAFADEHGFGEGLEGGLWYSMSDARYAFPAWLLTGRKRRWALRWDCCDLGSPEHYTRAAVLMGEEE